MVTVLFADVVGFTSLAEHRDPEQVRRLIDSCMQRLVADVHTHGGRVDKILGDGVLALFGAPTAHEDDAERGVRTGLAMQATVAELADELAESVRLRVGVNTGEVLVGALVAGGDYTAMGDVVNLAARLQTEAPAGSVLVGPATYAATESAIRYEPAGLVTVRGRVEPVEAWLAFKPLGRPGARHTRRHLPLVGREAELATLLAALDLSLTRQRPMAIAIEGEGGIGKSRLADELLEIAGERHGVLAATSRCLPYGESSALAPLAFVVRPLLDLGPDEPVQAELIADAVRRLGATVAVPAERLVDALVHLLGGPSPLDGIDPESAREEVVRAVASVIAASSRRRPVLIRVGDLHWADSSLVDALGRLLARLGNVPVALLTTARIDEDLAWPPSGARHSTVVLRLDPLADDDADRLVGLLIGGADDELRRDVLLRSGGNPLFIEQLAGLVAETGSVPPAGSALPDTLRGMVAARLDALAPGEREVLDNAAVLGMSGRWAMLERFGHERGQQPRRSMLDALAAAELLEVDGATWRFRSPSVRDVAYQMLTKASRAQRHAGVATAIEGRKSAGGEVPDVLAHHWLQAASVVAELGPVEHVPPDAAARALSWASIATTRAVARQAFATAERIAVDALTLVGQCDETPAHAGAAHGAVVHALLLDLAEARIGLRDFDGARADLESVLDPDAAATAGVLAQAHRLLGVLEYQAGRPAEAEVALAAAIARFRAVGDDAGLALALRSCGLVYIFAGRFADADAALAEAQELYIASGDARGLAWVNQHRAWTSFVGGDVDGADSRLDEAEASFAALGDPNGGSWVLGLRGFIRFGQGRLDEAEALAVANLRGAEEHGETWAAAMMRVLLAGLRLWSGRVSAARELADEARTGFRSIRDRYGEAQALGTLVRAEIAGGRPSDALRELERLISGADTEPRRAWAALVGAGAFVHLGEGHRAATQVEQALESSDLARTPVAGLSAVELWTALTIARLQIADVDGALAAADEALAVGADTPYAAAAVAAAYAAVGRRAEAVAEAERGLAHPAASYLDQALAAVTLALAGDGDTSDRARVVLAEVARGTEDTLVARLAAAVEARLRCPGDAADRIDAGADTSEERDVAGAERAPSGPLPEGWARALTVIADGVRSGEPSGAATA